MRNCCQPKPLTNGKDLVTFNQMSAPRKGLQPNLRRIERADGSCILIGEKVVFDELKRKFPSNWPRRDAENGQLDTSCKQNFILQLVKRKVPRHVHVSNTVYHSTGVFRAGGKGRGFESEC